jgi:hypothetical protein
VLLNYEINNIYIYRFQAQCSYDDVTNKKNGNAPVQAKPETVTKVCEIVKKQLALPDDSAVSGESKFAALGADSLDTVPQYLPKNYTSVIYAEHVILF